MKPREALRLYHQKAMVDLYAMPLQAGKPWIAIIDQDRGDQKGNIDLIEQLCGSAAGEGLDCLTLFALWGANSTQALKVLEGLRANAP